MATGQQQAERDDSAASGSTVEWFMGSLRPAGAWPALACCGGAGKIGESARRIGPAARQALSPARSAGGLCLRVGTPGDQLVLDHVQQRVDDQHERPG